jgi:hypothetical protein
MSIDSQANISYSLTVERQNAKGLFPQMKEVANSLDITLELKSCITSITWKYSDPLPIYNIPRD